MPDAHGSRPTGTASPEIDSPPRLRTTGSASLPAGDTLVLAIYPGSAPNGESLDAISPGVHRRPGMPLRKIGPSLQAGLRIGM